MSENQPDRAPRPTPHQPPLTPKLVTDNLLPMSPRMSADERREQVIRAAVAEFAIRGLEGTSTSDIAKRVGVSQPYLFRLFPTKRDLFIAAVRRGVERIRTEFSRAAEGKTGAEGRAPTGGGST